LSNRFDQFDTPFTRVSIADIFTRPSPPREFVIGAILPTKEVTLLPADGGVGKSMLSLIKAVCVAMGIPFMGVLTTQSKVIYFSAEDDELVVRYRLKLICEHLKVDPVELDKWLFVVDATDNPCLFSEFYDRETGAGVTTTQVYRRLHLTIDQWVTVGESTIGGIKRPIRHPTLFVVIDNASDTYEANENVRQQVRAFIRSLKTLARQYNGAFLLLAHLDKASVRDQSGKARYSGNTAWHNSCRSRLSLDPKPDAPEQLELRHEKSNHGRKAPPLVLEWTETGVLELAGGDAPSSAEDMTLDNKVDAVLALVKKCFERGQWINPSFASATKNNPYSELYQEPDYPRGLSKKELEKLLRYARARGLVGVDSYRCPVAKKDKERLIVVEEAGSDAE